MIRTGSIVEDTTAPIYADTLGELVDLVDRFGPFTDWTIYDRHSRRAAVRWSRLELHVRDRGDLRLAQAIAAERAAGRRAVTRIVAKARNALGWPGVYTPTVRCIGCGTTAAVTRPDRHAPYSAECDETRAEKMAAWDD